MLDPTTSTRSAASVFLAGLVAAGCTTVTGNHDPLYPAEPHTSVITAIADNSWFGISSIVIDVKNGGISDCSEYSIVPGMNTSSIIPCRRPGARQTTNECSFTGAPARAVCSANVPIRESALVSYTVTVTAGNALTTTTKEEGLRPA
jgi:hypothetical protein